MKGSRWVVIVALLVCTCVMFAANKKKSKTSGKAGVVPINIDVKHGTANPRHPHAQVGDSVQFTADKDCILDFHNSIFDETTLELKQGTPKSLVVKHDGKTDYCVENAPCPPPSKGKGMGSDPNDITVP